MRKSAKIKSVINNYMYMYLIENTCFSFRCAKINFRSFLSPAKNNRLYGIMYTVHDTVLYLVFSLVHSCTFNVFVVLQEVDQQVDEVIFDHIHSLAYQGTPLGRTILGPTKNIQLVMLCSNTDCYSVVLTVHFTH